MLLKKFLATGVHGYLSFDVEFHDDISFLTGINGSGKTTVLNCIISLLMPNLQFLADLEYNEIKIFIEHENEQYSIEAKSTENGARLTCSAEPGEDFEVIAYVPDPETPIYKQADIEQEYFREFATKFNAHPVMKFIASLPTPMYLGLNRRFLNYDEWAKSKSRSVLWRYPRKHNIFGASLESSLKEAVQLAEDSFRDASIQQNNLNRDLQKKLLLELVTIEPASYQGGVVMPTSKDMNDLDDTRKTLDALPRVLELEPDDVTGRLGPFLDYLGKLSVDIENYQKKQRKQKRQVDITMVQTMMNWTFNLKQIDKIKAISHHINIHNKQVKDIDENNEKYLYLINKFLRDGGKNVSFDKTGRISFASARDNSPRSFAALSSGEVQVFVILAHLLFNSLARTAGIFIIDEPELSLHVQWQEMFVDSLLDAGSQIQFVMATHSPSIILDRVSKCIELPASY